MEEEKPLPQDNAETNSHSTSAKKKIKTHLLNR
jgi:hypothetical protein